MEEEKNDKSHHLPNNGGFVNPWPSFQSFGFLSFFTLLPEFRFSRSTPPSEQVLNEYRKEIDLDLIRNKKIEGEDEARLTWLGHASMLLQVKGASILFDPIFSQRCSPFQFAGPKRYTPPPCDIKELADVVDAVVISHNHYDHLDLNTLKCLSDKMTYFVPLGNKNWILENVSKDAKVYECDWWDEHEVSFDNGNTKIKIVCLPCQHFTGRSIHDRFKTLWASWGVVTPKFRYFFGGDTGYRTIPKDLAANSFYDSKGNAVENIDPSTQKALDELPVCPAFKQIGAKYGPFDLACIPIGAYSPRWFMSAVHCSPEDSVLLHQDIMAKKSIGMHYLTFTLTDEPVLEPIKRLQRALALRGLAPNSFECIKIGETIQIPSINNKE